MTSKFLVAITIIFYGSALAAQKEFTIKNASKNYDIQLEVERCDSDECRGKARFSLFKKNESKPFQIIKLSNTYLTLSNGDPSIKTKMMYDEQSVIFFEDYNFDGFEDLALRDGNNGGYGGPSYQVYLFSTTTKRFVRNPLFTKLAQGVYLGMFAISHKRKTLATFSKSGCCWHQTEEFKVVNNRPKKVLEVTREVVGNLKDKVKITTKRLVGGKWHLSVKYEPLEN